MNTSENSYSFTEHGRSRIGRMDRTLKLDLHRREPDKASLGSRLLQSHEFDLRYDASGQLSAKFGSASEMVCSARTRASSCEAI